MVREANPIMKKWSLGKGIKLTVSFLRSELSWPENLRQQVASDLAQDNKWFKSPYIVVVSLRVLKQIL